VVLVVLVRSKVHSEIREKGLLRKEERQRLILRENTAQASY
jgi:hypothetical protein